MNANELADEIKNFYSHTNQPYFLIQLETMLRQQQAEIEALKAQIAELTEQNDAYYEESGKTYD